MDILTDSLLVGAGAAFGVVLCNARWAVRTLGHRFKKHDWHIDGKDTQGIRYYCACGAVKHG